MPAPSHQAVDRARVVLITGTSSGIGRACALQLARQGYRVYGASRRAQEPGTNFTPVLMDVTDDCAVQAGVDAIVRQEGRIDVVINNAGIGIAGAVEDTAIEEGKAQFETNFFGTLRVCRAVLAVMRERRSGTIVNVSSIAGVIAVPFQALYSASKFAIEGLTEALRLEVRPFGIEVVLLEPGDFRTDFTRNRVRTAASSQNPAYRERFVRSLAVMEDSELNGPSPEIVAAQVSRILQLKSPRARYRAGSLIQRISPAAKHLLPARLFERVLAGIYKLD